MLAVAPTRTTVECQTGAIGPSPVDFVLGLDGKTKRAHSEKA
jgi:hypothetical protein